MTLGELVREAARRLRSAPLHFGHGTTNARDESAFLVLRGLGLPFDAPAGRRVSAREAARVDRLLERRVRERIPVPYLLNEAWLSGESFYVDRRVIIPRSHIAFLLGGFGKPKRVLDLCTGSGCLAILAAKTYPRARVDAADISRAALGVAKRNIARHRLGGRVRLRQSDLMAGLGGDRYDLILCNPPYVDAHAMRALPREYLHEPRLALAAGADGLDLVRRILAESPDRLTEKGTLVCEIGRGRRVLKRTYPGTPFSWPETDAGAGQVFVLARPDLPQLGR